LILLYFRSIPIALAALRSGRFWCETGAAREWVSLASSSSTFRKIRGQDERYCKAAATAELKKKKATRWC
jgi:hypothetical protein